MSLTVTDLSELHPMIRPKMMLEDFAEWIENAVSSIFIMVCTECDVNTPLTLPCVTWLQHGTAQNKLQREHAKPWHQARLQCERILAGQLNLIIIIASIGHTAGNSTL